VRVREFDGVMVRRYQGTKVQGSNCKMVQRYNGTTVQRFSAPAVQRQEGAKDHDNNISDVIIIEQKNENSIKQLIK